MPSERNNVVDPILKWLRNNGAFAEKTHGSEYTRIGMPDIIACCGGYYVAIECKYGSIHDVTPAQLQCLSEINEAKGVAFSATSLAEVKAYLREWIQWPS